MPDKTSVDATPAARAELVRLRERHGRLMLFQSCGCCDGSSPLCLAEGELLVGPNDLLLGEIDDVPFFIDAEQYERWNRPHFVLDLAAGPIDAFSLEVRDGVHFVTRSDVCAPVRERQELTRPAGEGGRISRRSPRGHSTVPGRVSDQITHTARAIISRLQNG